MTCLFARYRTAKERTIEVRGRIICNGYEVAEEVKHGTATKEQVRHSAVNTASTLKGRRQQR